MVMRRVFPQHSGSGFSVFVRGCCIRPIAVDDVGHVHNEVRLSMGNGGPNRTAEQYAEN